MAAVASTEIASSPEGSPIRLEGARFHVHMPQERSLPSAVLSTSGNSGEQTRVRRNAESTDDDDCFGFGTHADWQAGRLRREEAGKKRRRLCCAGSGVHAACTWTYSCTVRSTRVQKQILVCERFVCGLCR